MSVRTDETVVFLSRNACHRLKPVCIVRGPFFNGPVFHRIGDRIGDLDIERSSVLDRFLQFSERILWQTLAHDRFIKYH